MDREVRHQCLRTLGSEDFGEPSVGVMTFASVVMAPTCLPESTHSRGPIPRYRYGGEPVPLRDSTLKRSERLGMDLVLLISTCSVSVGFLWMRSIGQSEAEPETATGNVKWHIPRGNRQHRRRSKSQGRREMPWAGRLRDSPDVTCCRAGPLSPRRGPLPGSIPGAPPLCGCAVPVPAGGQGRRASPPGPRDGGGRRRTLL